jgi:hypothetical protein
MCFRLAAVLLILSSFAIAKDQDRGEFCEAVSDSTATPDIGVTIRKVELSGDWGRNDALAYLPLKKIAEGGIVFSHSSIRMDNASVDLRPLAITLARAGAAVIVPERSLTWPPTDNSTNRESAVTICAAHWIVDHTNVANNGKPTISDNIVVRNGYAYVGPRLCDPAVRSSCHFINPIRWPDARSQHYRESVWVPVGETEGSDCTSSIISDRGLEVAHWLQRHLGLAPIAAVAGPSQ